MSNTQQPPTHLDTKELAARLKIHSVTAAQWRVKGIGPKYIKIGKVVLYPIAEVEAWEKSQTIQSTSQG